MKRTVQLQEEHFSCAICFEVAENAVESECCHNLFCEECAKQIKQCPTCRKARFLTKTNILVRRMIEELEIECPFCNSLLQRGNLEQHKKNCKDKPLEEIPTESLSNEKKGNNYPFKVQRHNLNI